MTTGNIKKAFAYLDPEHPTVRAALAEIEQQAARIAELEAANAIPDYAMPPSEQEWEKLDPAVAFHLIERHAENWGHAGQLMEAWRIANSPAPVADSAMAKDAERYRWLREQRWEKSDMFVVAGSKSKVMLGTDCPSRARLDAAIDAAIAASAEKEG